MGIEGLKVDEINSKVTQYWRVSVTEETGSTQNDLVNNFSPGSVLVTEYQSAGRGRLDRKFEVPKRMGLTFSFCIEDLPEFEWIPLITGLAVSKAINNYVGRDLVRLKWPNDLLIASQKLGGILCEKVKDGVVVGVGINIFQSQAELPIEQATSLSMHAEVDRNLLLIEILNSLGSYLSDIPGNQNKYREFCATIGSEVEVTLPSGEVIKDEAIGISESGALILKWREVTVGDVVHVR